jgi:hypothetical protein
MVEVPSEMDTGAVELSDKEKDALKADTAANVKLSRNPHSHHLLKMVTGVGPVHILEDATQTALEEVWKKLDYNGDGELSRADFTSLMGTDPVWIDLLNMCDINADGVVEKIEFMQGFLLSALESSFQIEERGTTSCLGMLMTVQRVANAQVMNKVGELNAYMRSKNATGW